MSEVTPLCPKLPLFTVNKIACMYLPCASSLWKVDVENCHDGSASALFLVRQCNDLCGRCVIFEDNESVVGCELFSLLTGFTIRFT